MSAVTFNTGYETPKSIVNQGFSRVLTNPSDAQSLRLSRRGRLARTLVVLSLAVVMVAGFAAKSGAGQEVASSEAANSAPAFAVVVVAPGKTLWSVAAAYATGDVAGMVNEIREANNLIGFDLQAGQKLRVPVQSR